MAQKIYKVYMLNMKEAWYQLSKKQQDTMLGKLQDAIAKVGGKIMLMCSSSWSNDAWQIFGIEEFPSIEAVQEHAKILAELEWFRYEDAKSLLGTEYTLPE